MIAVQSEFIRQVSPDGQGGCDVFQIQLGSGFQARITIGSEIQFQNILNLIVSGWITSFVEGLRGMDFPKSSIP